MPKEVLYNGVVKPCILVQSFNANDFLGISGYGAGGSGGVVVTISPNTTNIYSNYRVVLHELGHVWNRSHKPLGDTSKVYMNTIYVNSADTYGAIDRYLIAIDIQDDSDSWINGPCEIDGTLPLSLLFFSAEAEKNNIVLLKWQTAAEVGRDEMTLFKSIDGEHWEKIYTTTSLGIPEGSSYSFTDSNLSSDIAYYKLEINGESWVRSVNKGKPNDFQIYPNPSNGKVTVITPTPTSILVFDVFGRLIQSFDSQYEQIEIDLLQGVYIFQIGDKNERVIVW